MREVFVKRVDGEGFRLSRETNVIAAFMEISNYVGELTYKLECSGEKLLNFINEKKLDVDVSKIDKDINYIVMTYDW